MKGGNAQVWSQAGKIHQRLQRSIGAPVPQTEGMPGQKISGGDAGSPAGADARTAFVPSPAGAFGIFQFGFDI